MKPSLPHESAVMAMLYGAIHRIAQDQDFYDQTQSNLFNRFTDEGVKALVKCVETILPLMAQIEQEKLNHRAMAITAEELSKNDQR